jgi:LysM repeat protein
MRLEMRGAKKFIVHRVVKGDAIESIAAKYAVSSSDILSNNPLITDRVFPGQILKIPINEAKYGAVMVPPVKSLAPSKLPLAKTLPPPNTVVAKEVAKSEAIDEAVNIPVPPSKEELNSTEYKIYVVASPQTVNQLAASFAIEPEAIIELNSLKNHNLKEGQKVKIPNINPAPVLVQQEIEKPEILLPEPKVEVAKVEEKKPEAPKVAAQKIEPIAIEKTIAKLDSPKVESKSGLSKLANNANQMKELDKKPEEKVSPLLAKKNAKKVEIVLNQDSMMMVELMKKRNMELLMKMDSDYIHPQGIAYKVFDYKETNYNYDLFSLLTAEENAIVVPNTNQNTGVGDAQKTHVVKKDETLQGIAKKYKVSATDIINWNGLLSYRVRAGQELTINASRAQVSPYVRTLPSLKNIEQSKAGEDIVGYEKVAGLAQFNNKQAFTRGVYTNATEKGRFVYLVNRDNFKEHFARVLGPLPKGTPDDIIVILDPQSAEQLGISKSLMRVYVYFGIVNAPTEAKN